MRLPVVAVCGATGTGKSKLAIDLALAFNGEVLNADAVQLYKGLDIATNKVSEAEMQGVKHHLLGILDPRDGFRYNVHHYRTDCWSLIDRINLPNSPRLPIIAGGTHYYIEAVLWKDFLQTRAIMCDSKETLSAISPVEKRETEAVEEQSKPLENLPHRSWPEELLRELPSNPQDYYAFLWNLDESAARGLHPNDTRKLQQAILSRLAINKRPQTQNQLETVGPEPSSTAPASNVSTNRSYSPKYDDPQSLIIWLDCDPDVLKPRLDQRIHEMVERGLIAELDRFLCSAATSLLPSAIVSSKKVLDDATKNEIFRLANDGLLPSVGAEHWCRGILQSIGFKEFELYLRLPEAERHSDDAKRLLSAAIERMQFATRQYARRQRSWIIKRFLERPAEGGIPVYRLDVTNVLNRPDTSTTSQEALWSRDVLQPALRIVRSNLPLALREQLPDDQLPPPSPEPFRPVAVASSPAAGDTETGGLPPYICAACNGRIFVERQQWQAHLQSRLHKKRMSSLRKKASMTLSDP
ncbi:tRNA dimethylallyltransferase [Sparganum proliferum]